MAMPISDVRFAHLRFEPSTRELFKHGRRVRLGEKPARLLEALVARPGELVTRRELRDLLWEPDTFVDFDNNLNSAVATLREVMGDSASAPRYIETLPRLGYRFIAVIEYEARPSITGSAPLVAEAVTAPARRQSRPVTARWAALAAAVLTAVVSGGVSHRPIGDSLETPAVRDVRYLLARGTTRDLELATQMLDGITGGADAPADALEVLAETWLARALRHRAPAAAFERAETAAQRALAADRRRAGAWRVRAGVRLYRGRDPHGAAGLVARAIAAQPDDPATRLMAATVDAARGRYDAAVDAATLATRLDPASWRVRADLAFFLLAAGRYEEALAESRSTLTLEPASSFALDMLMTAAERSHEKSEARDAAVALMEAAGAPSREIDAVRTSTPRGGLARYRRWQIATADRLAESAAWPPLTAAAIYAATGDASSAMRWLRRAEQAGDPMLILLPAMRDFDPVSGDPAFRAFVAGLAPNAG